MSVIRSVATQWKKAELAHQLHIYLSQDQVINELFVGATSKNTICNLIVAMIEPPIEPVSDSFKVNQDLILDYFFQCFHLLFIKEIEHHNLTQAEQLIVSISVYLANVVNERPECVAENTLQKSTYIITAMSRLKFIRKQHRKLRCNMISK
ncbi:hypothetical protein [Shewanella frigidimarina]|uniref:hypothetical protein n=1 Tax=Shewanella frigidimarina TaxID=56812 RepID=UPI003D7B813E